MSTLIDNIGVTYPYQVQTATIPTTFAEAARHISEMYELGWRLSSAEIDLSGTTIDLVYEKDVDVDVAE